MFSWNNFFLFKKISVLFNREMSTDSFLDLDIFNLSEKSKTPPSASSVSGTRGEGLSCDLLMEEDIEDNAPLFWQPGKRGYYSPRIGKASPERLNAFRNIGRYYCCQTTNNYKQCFWSDIHNFLYLFFKMYVNVLFVCYAQNNWPLFASK